MDASNIERLWSLGESLPHLSRLEEGSIDTPGYGPSTDVSQGLLIPSVDLTSVKEILQSHDSVDKASVTHNHGTQDQDDEIIAFITLNPLTLALRTSGAKQQGHDQETQSTQFWDGYWDGCVYPAMEALDDKNIGRDFLGWTSMYDGQEIDKTDMNEWLDETLTTIRTVHGKPRHVLELGAGSGMILFNLAHEASSYVGLEMSSTAVKFVTNAAKKMSPDMASKVTILQGTAADLPTLALPTSPDLVIVNSVAQYFPSQAYLLDVVDSLVHLPAAETLFFGDIRSYAFYDEFLVTKALHDAGGKASKRDVRARMSALARRDLELLIDPAFFTALRDRYPDRVEHIQILPKRMKAVNELSCFRYAAVVYLKNSDDPSWQPREIRDIKDDNEWTDLATLERSLHKEEAVAVAVSNIPNNQIAFQRHAVDSLLLLREGDDNDNDNDNATQWLSEARQAAQRQPSISAFELQELAQRAGYRVELSAARQHSQRGGLDAVFYRHGLAGGGEKDKEDGGRVLFRFPTDHQGRDLKLLSTHPLELQAKQAVVDQLEERLQEELPVHLVPRRMEIVESLPV